MNDDPRQAAARRLSRVSWPIVHAEKKDDAAKQQVMPPINNSTHSAHAWFLIRRYLLAITMDVTSKHFEDL